MTDFKLLEKLCTVEGISGDEGSVREIIINEIKPFADEIKTDNLGNIIVICLELWRHYVLYDEWCL